MARFHLLLSLALVLGCSARPRPAPGAGVGDDAAMSSVDGAVSSVDAGPAVLEVDAGMQGSCERMDLLFVIDDSISMAQEQANLTANFPGFISVLDEFRTDGGEPLDYRVAVTTTGRSVDRFLRSDGMDYPNGVAEGDDGAFRMGCGMTRPWIERGDANVSGDFSCIAEVGINGPTDEMPLGTLRLALTERARDGTNAGFIRQDALLAIVVLTDEDDCSTRGNTFTIDGSVDVGATGACVPGRPVELEDVSTTVRFLDSLKGDPGRWAVAVIAGPGPDRCTSDFGEAIPATRLLDLVERKAPRASFSSVCEGDLTGALAEALATFDAACRAFPPLI